MKINLRLWLLFPRLCLLFPAGCVNRYYNVATQKEEVYLYSSEREVQIGKKLSHQVELRFAPENDILLQQKLDRIGKKLAGVSDRLEINYHFKLLNEKEVNAFALPGGYIYVFKGLWNKIADKDEMIAAVLAHELAHLSARHNIKRLQNAIGYGALAVLVNTADTDAYSRAKATLGINKLLLNYSREEELEADILAVKYLKLAGYDPRAMLKVLEVLRETQRRKPLRPLVESTHPYIAERIKVIREAINNGNINFDDYINTYSRS